MSATFSPAMYRKGSPLSEEQKAIARAIDEATADLAALRAAVPALMRVIARIEADERLSNRQKHVVFTVLDAIVEGAKDG